MPGCLPLVELPSETGFEKEIALLGIFDLYQRLLLGCAPLATSLISSHLNLKCVHLLVTPVYSVYILLVLYIGCAHFLNLKFLFCCVPYWLWSIWVFRVVLYIVKMYIVCMLLTWLWELTTTGKWHQGILR